MADRLVRALNLPLLWLYGLGTILGAGIYVLVGEVAASAGVLTPVSFLVAAVLAGLIGLGYAELSTRYPEAAGEAAFVEGGFGRPALSATIGLLVALSGIVSCAAIAQGFSGYLRVVAPVPDGVATGALVVALGLLAWAGVEISVGAAAVMTGIEVTGLLLVVGGALPLLADLPEHVAATGMGATPASGVFVGAFLCFYAYIGFEDMVNVAEEVHEPRKVMPRAILGAVAAATALYLLVAVVCVLALPLGELAGSDAPLALVWERSTGRSPWIISAISLVAVSNGALVQVIMASRVLYGLSENGWLPGWVGHVSPRTRTPDRATALVTAIVLVLALALPLKALAEVTTFLLLGVMAVVHTALWRIHRRGPAPEGVFSIPRWIPPAAVAGIVAFVGFRLVHLVGG